MKKLLPIFFALVGLTVQAQNYTALNGPNAGSPKKIIEAGGFLLSIANSNGVLKSTNGGASWTSSNTGITNLNISDITKDAVSGKLYAVAYNQLFTSTDNGANWTLTANSGFVAGTFIRKTTSFLYIIGNGTIYRSSNDGSTWGAVNVFTGSLTDFEVNASGHFFLVTTSGIYRSTNNGLNLDLLAGGAGLTDLNLYSLTISGTTLYVLSYSGPFKSTNNGTTWASTKTTITDCCFGWGTIIEKDPSGNIYAFNGSKVWKTTNTGTSWTSFNSPILSGQSGELVSVYFESTSIFYVGIDGVTLYKTIDSGASWIPLFSTGLSTISPQDFIMTDNGRLLYAFGYPYGMHISIDDGATWDFLASGTTARRIGGFQKIGSTIYGYGTGVIKSIDNGSNWTEVNATHYFDNLATSSNGVNMYSLTQTYDGTNWVWGLNKSKNSGTTWTSTPQTLTGMPSTNCSYIPYPQTKEMFLSGNHLFVRLYDYCLNKSSLFKVDITTGVATEITSVLSSVNVNAFDIFNDKLYVLTNNSRLHISNDGGVNWVTKTTTTSFGNLEIIDDNTYYILNTSVFLSKDGGTTWVNTGSPGSTNKTNRRVLVSSANYSYIAQDYGLVYKSNAPVVPPIAPSGLASFGRDRNSVGLIWNDNSNNEDRFVIEASEGDNLSYDSIAQATRPNSWSRAQGVALISSIAGAALKNNTTYYFRVRASGAGGKSAPSNEISVTTLVDCTTTSALPQNRSWTATTLNTSGVGVLTALNQTLTGATGNYSIQNLPIGAGVGLSPAPQNPWAVGFEENCGSVFVSSTTQYISNGNGTWDPVTKKVTIPWQTHPQYPSRSETTVYTLNASDPVPAVPTNFIASVFTPGAILLNWASGTFTLLFEVERSTTSGSGFVKIADVNFPIISYKDLDPALVAGTTYFYRIRAKNATGSSAYTGEVSVIPRTNYLFLPMNNLPGKTFSRTGAGGAWGDVDGDGINDLLLPLTTDSTGLNLAPPLIFKSLGNGQFTKYTIPELATEARQTRNANIIDINNDGRNDLYLSRATGNFDLLLIKNADGSYQKVEMTEHAQGGLPDASWADYDNDGYIDLLATTSLGNGSASDKILYLNNSGDGTFTRITEGELVTDFGATRKTQWADYDNDGDQDVIVLNQIASVSLQDDTRLYRNNGDGTFTRVLGSVFESFFGTDRSCSWGDYDNDGDLDIFIAGSSNRLYRNLGDGTFAQVTGSVVEEDQLITGGSYGSGWGDIDNDGDLDLFAMGFNSILYFNDGDGTFTKYTTQELFNAPNLAKLYGPAFEDVDNDGFLDFHNGGFSNPDIANFIYRNTTPASASRRWIKLNLRGTISNRSAIGARVTLVAGGVTQIREVQSHTAQSTQSSPTQHFGVGSNATITSITVDWPSGLSQTYNAITPNQTLTIVEDGTGPVGTILLPVNNANNAPIDTKIEITFDEPPIAVAGKTVKVFISGNAIPVFTLNATDGVITGNKASFTLSSNLLAAKTYSVEVEAGSYKDQFDNLSAAIIWSFTTIDATGPAITFTAASTINKGFNSTTLSATIADNSGTVSSAKLSHRKIAGGAFVDAIGVFNVGESKWEFTVQESFFDANGLEYYISSTDPTGNVGRLPATTNFYTHLLYNAENNLVPSERLGFGGTTAGWRIFSIPFELGSNSAVSTVFDELDELEIKKDWRLVTLDNTTWDEYPSDFSTFARGKGYFINIRTPGGGGIKMPETTAPSNNRNNLFQITLKAGWNQIGNPYLTAINWSDVVTFNNLTGTAQQLKTYNGTYNNGTSLQPFEGGFVLSASGVVISIPFAGQTTPGGRQGQTTFEEGDWVLPLNLKQGELENNFGGIGMHQQADFSYDQLDDINAPRFLDYVEMNFDHPEHFAKRFARDVVPKQDEYIWSFKVGTSLTEDTQLLWDNTLLQDVPQDLFLLDEAKQVLVNMREQHAYKFDPKKSTTFKIYFGENLKDKIKPSVVYLGKPFPNPTNDRATISYTLPPSNSFYQVQLEVYNAVGQRVNVLVNAEHESGFYSTTWDVQNNQGGLYFYRLAVSSNGTKKVLTEKIIINR